MGWIVWPKGRTEQVAIVVRELTQLGFSANRQEIQDTIDLAVGRFAIEASVAAESIIVGHIPPDVMERYFQVARETGELITYDGLKAFVISHKP